MTLQLAEVPRCPEDDQVEHWPVPCIAVGLMTDGTKLDILVQAKEKQPDGGWLAKDAVVLGLTEQEAAEDATIGAGDD